MSFRFLNEGQRGNIQEFTPIDTFIDPVSKIRVSNPSNLIDTDFEYGLQPTKWETVELINNTPAFFSKSGDTTISDITGITTNAGTREVTVTTAFPHNLAVGIPIRVAGTKSVTADGSYIINATPTDTTFTYLARANQTQTISIFDLYTSIITGEFFQGSQISIDDAEGITTDEAGPISTLTVKTPTKHGFGLNTPFYFLNLNSTISQEFESQNSASLSFDPSNSATAQTFDGSNTLLQTPIDLSNSATTSTFQSVITSTNPIAATITVALSGEDWSVLKQGSPLYYSVSVGGGYFQQNPRGVVFIKDINNINQSGGTATFQVSQLPDGSAIPVLANMTGFFQIANQARTFAGNNVNPETQIDLEVIVDEPFLFDGGNQGYDGVQENPPSNTGTVVGYTGTSVTLFTAQGTLDYYVGAMLKYSTNGTAATGLVNNGTYFVSSFGAGPSAGLFNMSLSELPGPDEPLITISGGSGTQTFQKIGISIDKDIVHVKNSNFQEDDMLKYIPPTDGEFEYEFADEKKIFFFVETAYDAHNYTLADRLRFRPIKATGGNIITEYSQADLSWRVHQFTSVGAGEFVVEDPGTDGTVDVLIVAGGGSGAHGLGAGGGGGGVVDTTTLSSVPKPVLSAGTYSIVVGAGGIGPVSGEGIFTSNDSNPSQNGGNSSAFGLTALGGGGGGHHREVMGPGRAGGSGGGGGARSVISGTSPGGAALQPSSSSGGYGNPGGTGRDGVNYPSGGGGGAGQAGETAPNNSSRGGKGGDGVVSTIDGNSFYYGGGGGGCGHTNGQGAGNGGLGGGGGGSTNAGPVGIGGGSARNPGANGLSYGSSSSAPKGANGGANTGGGGGGGAWSRGEGGNGGSGIVIVRYPLTTRDPKFLLASGGQITTAFEEGTLYAVHQYRGVGPSSFEVERVGLSSQNNQIEYLVVGGGGGGGNDMGGGGGAGGFLDGSFSVNETGSYNIFVGNGGNGAPSGTNGPRGSDGQSSSVVGGSVSIVALGGGGGASDHDSANFPAGGVNNGQTVASGGGGSGGNNNNSGVGYGGGRSGTGTPGQGFDGGAGLAPWYPGGGGGAGQAGSRNPGKGGDGKPSSILGRTFWFAGGGGGSGYTGIGGNGGRGGGGGGAVGTTFGGADSINPASGGGGGSTNSQTNTPGGNAAANSGGGGGGGSHFQSNNFGGRGGSGIVVLRYPIYRVPSQYIFATGGDSVRLVEEEGILYAAHNFTSIGSSNFSVTKAATSPGDNTLEYLIVAGGGGGGGWGGGGGGGGLIFGSLSPSSSQSFNISVGGGGAAGTSAYTAGGNGANSSAFGLTAIGGGGGGHYNGNVGRSGGSGGGGGLAEGGSASGGAGTSGQGFNGGPGGSNINGWQSGRGGGGGGAGGAGFSGVGGATDSGRGGPGRDFSSKFGSSVGELGWFSGGGGGHSGTMSVLSIGGQGGGGRGGRHASGSGTGALDGMPNTGGGAGGAWGGSAQERIGIGGSGIVIIRYPIGVV
jgi:hypothetical protein